MERDPVAVRPHARVAVEVGGPVATAVVVAPEPHGHRRHGRGDHQLALLPDHRLAVLGVRLDLGAQVAARDLARPDGHQRAPADEGGAHVGATAHRGEQQVGAHGLVDPVEPLGRQRRAGRADPPQSAEVGHLARHHARLAAGEEEGRGGAEEGDALVGRHPPQGGQVGMAGVAVEQHRGGPHQQARHEVVPHHPAGRREPEEAVARPEVVVQGQHLVVLDEDAAVAVHDRLGEPGGPGGVQDVERVVERDVVDLEVGRLGDQLGPGHRPVVPGRLGVGGQVRHRHGRAQRRQLGPDRRHLGGAVDGAVAVAVAVHRQQHGGLDLAQPVDDAAGAELRRARRPDRAQAGRGQEGDDRLGDVGQVGGHAVAAAHPQPHQARTTAGHLLAQLGHRQLVAAAGLREPDQGRAVRLAAQGVGRVVQPGAREPAGAGHGGVGQRRADRGGRVELEVVPHRLPEPVEVGDRPAPQGVVVVEPQAPLRRQPLQVAADAAALADVRRWLPQHASPLDPTRLGTDL